MDKFTFFGLLAMFVSVAVAGMALYGLMLLFLIVGA